MSDKVIDPSKHLYKNGDLRIPPHLQHLENAHRDSIIMELVLLVYELQDRVEELEFWLPRPPEEEDDER